MKPSKEIKFVGNVAKEIIRLKFKSTMTLKQVENKFYAIMRKYKIKQGTKSGNGVIMNNFEWTMCQILFMQRIQDYFQIDRFLFGTDTPKSLMYY